MRRLYGPAAYGGVSRRDAGYPPSARLVAVAALFSLLPSGSPCCLGYPRPARSGSPDLFKSMKCASIRTRRGTTCRCLRKRRQPAVPPEYSIVSTVAGFVVAAASAASPGAVSCVMPRGRLGFAAEDAHHHMPWRGGKCRTGKKRDLRTRRFWELKTGVENKPRLHFSVATGACTPR